MPQVPIYNREVTPNGTATPYISLNTDSNTFGENTYRAMGETAKQVQNFGAAMLDIKNRVDETKILELNNISNNFSQTELYDKDNGYFYKTGKDAYGKSQDYMKNYDKLMQDYIQSAKFSPANRRRAEYTYSRLRSRINEQVTAHDYQSGVEWAKNEASLSLQNCMTQGVNLRNDNKAIESNLANAYHVIEWQGGINHADEDSIKVQKLAYTQKYYEAIAQAKLGEGQLAASQFIEANKDKFNPEVLPKLIAAAKDNELNYTARNTAQYLTTLDPQQAYEEINKLYKSDVQKAQAIEGNYLKLKHQEQAMQGQIYNEFLNTAAEKFKNGEEITENDIPQNLKGQNYFSAIEKLEQLNRQGDINTDETTWVSLNYDLNYNAQKFKTLNLDEYRMSLSKKDYEYLREKQREVESGKYITTIDTTSKSLQNYAKSVSGISDKELVSVYSQFLREFELKRGRQATELEKEEILKSLGYSKDTYRQIKKAAKQDADFFRDLSNNISYYQARHNGEMPDEKTIDQWAKQLTINSQKQSYNMLKNMAVQNTTPKTNEQITLTNFADNYIPQLSKSIGVDLKVTDRYRQPNGKYNSRHSEGRALDVSYKTKNGNNLTLDQKKQLITNIIARPDVEKIAISSADKDGKAILKYAMDNYGKRFGYKIQDTYTSGIDKKLGTDHTNHVHITLKKDNALDLVALKNKLKSHGYSDVQINKYFQMKGLI